MISKSNHVKFARFVLLGVSEEAKKITSIFSVQCIIKQLLDSDFVIFRIIEVLVRVISLSLLLRLITPTSTSIILDITKTSSNNCLKLLPKLWKNYKNIAFRGRPAVSYTLMADSICVTQPIRLQHLH